MKLERSLTTKIAYLLDNWIPPAIRDSRWFMWLPFRLLFGAKSHYFFRFKDQAFQMTHEEFSGIYETLASVHISRETDLNTACIDQILNSLKGDKVLEVGCGRGFLANKLATRSSLTACDMHISPEMKTRYPDINFEEANVEQLPYADKSFDTVICTHTLEHVTDLVKAVSELRRVASSRLIIVVPKQRPYQYTFDLHLHFFPYKWSLLAFLKGGKNVIIQELAGDWYYQEDMN